MARTSEATATFVEQRVACAQCGSKLTIQRLEIGGKKTPLLPVLCESCSADEKAQEPEAPDGLSREERIFPLMHAAGVNVRKHGRCMLLEGFGEASRGERFDTSECGSEPLDAAAQFVEETIQAGEWGLVQGVLFIGPLGSGKTHLAAAIVRSVLLDERIDPSRVIFDRADRLITIIQDTYGTGSTAALLERREEAHLLVIDDLGQEKATPDALRILVDLVNAREGHPTVITSNHTPSGLVERFKGAEGWQRLASRLGRQNFRHVSVAGHDRRAVA